MFTNMRSITAILAAASVAYGHMIMKDPAPYGGDGLDNSPLTSSNYPCKVKGDPATFYKGDLGNTIAIGETKQVSFKGSATHGGGACQFALTEDLQPSASTSWKVIQSIEGGCPAKTGTGPDTYDYQIPDGIAPGKYVFAWTWVSKLAGQPEYYMNCAPLTVTGSKKRSTNETELVTRDVSFPELFVANLAEINDCKTEPSTDVKYPDPGSNVKSYGTPKLAEVKGQNCVPKGLKSGGSSGSGPSDGGSKSGQSAAPGSTAGTGATKSLPTAFITSVLSGTGASAGITTATPTSTVNVDPICTPSNSSSSSSSTSSSSSASSQVQPSTTSSAAPATSSTPVGGNSSAGALMGPCTEEGTFNCIGGTSYQQCASGSWSVVMQMAPTVKCAPGKSTNLFARDDSPLRRLRLRRRAH